MALSNPEIIINGEPWAIVPNSFEFDEGQPEKMVRAAVVGDKVSQEFSKNMESAFSEFKFSVYPTAENIDAVRVLENNDNTNTITSVAVEVVRGVEKTMRRTFKNACIASKTKKPLGADTVIELNWKSDAAV